MLKDRVRSIDLGDKPFVTTALNRFFGTNEHVLPSLVFVEEQRGPSNSIQYPTLAINSHSGPQKDVTGCSKSTYYKILVNKGGHPRLRRRTFIVSAPLRCSPRLRSVIGFVQLCCLSRRINEFQRPYMQPFITEPIRFRATRTMCLLAIYVHQRRRLADKVGENKNWSNVLWVQFFGVRGWCFWFWAQRPRSCYGMPMSKLDFCMSCKVTTVKSANAKLNKRVLT